LLRSKPETNRRFGAICPRHKQYHELWGAGVRSMIQNPGINPLGSFIFPIQQLSPCG